MFLAWIAHECSNTNSKYIPWLATKRVGIAWSRFILASVSEQFLMNLRPVGNISLFFLIDSSKQNFLRYFQAVTFHHSGSKTFWKRERLIDRHTFSVVLRILMSLKRFSGNSCGTSYQHRTYPYKDQIIIRTIDDIIKVVHIVIEVIDQHSNVPDDQIFTANVTRTSPVR